MKKILSILCVFSLILGIGSINLTASADNSENTEIDFVQLRYAEKYESNGKKGARFYKQNVLEGEMFVAKTNCELKNNTKYLISMDYKSAVRKLQPTVTLMNTDNMEGWDDNGYLGNDLASLYADVYSGWSRVSFIVDTTGKVDDTHKYLSFAGKAWGATDEIDYAICNVSVTEIDDNFEFTSFDAHFGYIDDGERQYADFTCPDSYYTGIGFAAKINALPATEYLLMFDYKKQTWLSGESGPLKIDDTVVADLLNLPNTNGVWQEYSVKIKTPDVINKQELKFNVSTYEGYSTISFDNFRLIPLNSNNIYPTYLRDMARYKTDTNEYGWQFKTSATDYIITGFTTDYVLEPGERYLITVDYKQPVYGWNALFFGAANNYSDVNGFDSLERGIIANINWTQTSEWTSLVAIIDTGTAVNEENKYFGVWGKTSGVPDFAFKNLRIQKMSSEYIYPEFFRDMVMYSEDNGDVAWKFNTQNDGYVVTGYTTGYELKPNSAYAINFDYKQSDSSWNGDNALKFGAASNVTDWLGHESINSHLLGHLNLDNEADWKNKTVIIKTESIVDETNKYLGVWGQTAGLPDFAFKNLTVTEIENNQVMPKWEKQFTYSFDSDGKIVWNLSKKPDDYSYLGFTTDLILKNDKDYVIAFDYKYLKKGWLAWSLEPQVVGNSFVQETIKEQKDEKKQTLNDRNLNTDWETRKVAFTASNVTDENKYLAFFGKANPGAEYDISLKNIRLYDLGDVDFSGDIDTTDLAVLRKELLGVDSTAQFTDVNKDGDTDIRDLVHLKKLFIK